MAIRKEKQQRVKTNNSNEVSAKDQSACLPRVWKKEKFLKKFVVQENPKMVRTEAEKDARVLS